jgi:gliding motility-associated-like protein
MKRLCVILIVLGMCFTGKANHITGGQIYYTFTGVNNGNYTYSVTLLLYRDHFSSGAQLDAAAAIGIYNNSNNSLVWNQSITLAFVEEAEVTSPDPCINNPPIVYYDIGHYNFSVTLPANAVGYTIAYQRCCRIAGISNLQASSSVGATYTAIIPGTAIQPTGPANNSAHFIGDDTVIVCQNNYFTYNFGAADIDGDSLAYTFCDAYVGGNANTQGGAAPNPPAPPPYLPVPYLFPQFSGGSPMGTTVTINPRTGLVSGIAPAQGIYVVTVCVTEFRNGEAIATQRKDLQIKVGDCSLAQVTLAPEYISCDGYSWTFANGGDQTLIHSYLWTFGDPSTGTNDSSLLSTPTHIFSDTGIYIVKLITNRGEPCSDTGSTIMKVYPGFFPAFGWSGLCINKPTRFTDSTATQYGFVNTWGWDFGVTTIDGDTSHLQNPSYIYTIPGTYAVQFIVTNSKGCIDTVVHAIDIYDKPPITLVPRDTILCVPDSVQLHAQGNGVFSWSPPVNIINANSPDPIVHPTSTMYYYVVLDDNGCINRDSVRVRVVDHVTLSVMNDTTACQSDPVQLNAQSDGTQYTWTPAAPLNDPHILNPIATVSANTTFQLLSTIGSCRATANVNVFSVPYPSGNAGPDQTICFNTPAQLHATIVGTTYSWSPFNSLSNPASLDPIATPSHTTDYILTVFDTRGCPKPGRDTITVNVRPKMNVSAGNDTAVVVGQPLHFHASGGVNYTWTPSTGLSATNISDPIGIYDGSADSIRYKVIISDESNCVDSANVTVKIFKTNPQIFVPTAFTPNGDGLNDLFRPLGVGIKKFEYFRVYNRWGQLVFSTTTNGQGWDGKVAGREQGSNTFVWVVKGIDYLDKSFFKKGTVTLVR